MELDGQKIKSMLIDKCWTANYLAHSAKVSPTTLNKIINKEGRSNTATIGRIAKALNVPAAELIK